MGIKNIDLKKLSGFWSSTLNDNYRVDFAIRENSKSFYDEIHNGERNQEKSKIFSLLIEETNDLPILHFEDNMKLLIFDFDEKRNEMILIYPDGTKRTFKRINIL